MRRARFLPVAAVLLLLLLVPGAGAHAVLQSSVPSKGARLDVAPAYVTVTLTEPADPEGSSLIVLGADGQRADLDDLTFTSGSKPTLRISLPLDLPDGAYRIAWQALSGTDGHTTRGLVGFAVGNFLPPESEEADPGVPWLGAAGRFLAFLGLALVLGSAIFLAWVPGAVQVPRRPVLEALLVGASIHLLGVVVLFKATLDETGLSAALLATTSVGKVLLLRLGLGVGALVFAGIASAPRVRAHLPPYVTVILVAVAGLGAARFGHASLTGLAGIAVDALHLLAAAAWVGGLLVFLWLLVEAQRLGWSTDQIRLAGVRFGTAAMVCVILLVAAGLAASLAILGLPDVSDPWATLRSPWGQILAAKVVLTAIMLAIAAANRYGILEPSIDTGFAGRVQRALTRLAPKLQRLDTSPSGLRRLLRTEALLGVVVLALAGVLTSISPPADASNAVGQPLDVVGSGDEFHGVLTITPAPTVGGTSTLRVHIETHQGVPVEGNTCGREPPLSCVSAVIGASDAGETHSLQPVGDGAWSVAGVLWTTAGNVAITVTVSTSEVFEDSLTFVFTVQASA